MNSVGRDADRFKVLEAVLAEPCAQERTLFLLNYIRASASVELAEDTGVVRVSAATAVGPMGLPIPRAWQGR